MKWVSFVLQVSCLVLLATNTSQCTPAIPGGVGGSLFVILKCPVWTVSPKAQATRKNIDRLNFTNIKKLVLQMMKKQTS